MNAWKWRSLFILPALVVLTASAEPPKVSKKLQGFLGAKAVEILKEADKVEVFLIDPVKPQQPPEKSVAGYKITTTGPELGGDFAGKLASVLLDDRTYFNPDKFSLPHPTVGFRIWKSKEAVDVAIALNNNVLEVHSPDGKGKTKAVYGNFDPMRAPLLKLIKEALPKEKDIQAMQ